MAFLLALLAGTNAGNSCFDFPTSSTCNTSILFCSWNSEYACEATTSACDGADQPTCMQTQGCAYGSACTSVCDGVVDPSSCATTSMCMVVDNGYCGYASCSDFNANACPSSCYSSPATCSTMGFDLCTTHSAAVCGNVAGCTWKNGVCQSPCWSQSASSCASMPGCQLSTAACIDPQDAPPSCVANLSSSDCNSYQCQFNQSGTGICELTCDEIFDQLSCANSSACLAQGTCQTSPSYTSTCSNYSDNPSCIHDNTCHWDASAQSCYPISCEEYGSATECSAMRGCTWEAICTANYNPGCYQYTDPLDCLDTSTGRSCQLNNYCSEDANSLCFSLNMTNCGKTASCAWQSSGMGPLTGGCYSTCGSYSSNEGQCSTTPGCSWTVSCTDVTVSIPTPMCPGLSEADCTAPGVNSYLCAYQPGCFLTGGGGSECLGMNATACWANSDCFFGAGECFSRCSFLTSTQCSTQAGCSWQTACTFAELVGLAITFKQNPEQCDIGSSLVFPEEASPCANETCSQAWPNPTYTPACNAIAKTYCCGTNSTTCSMDDQCYEKNFGDGPLCPWRCDFETLITKSCQTVGQCSATSVAYSKSNDFSTNSMADFDLSLTPNGLNPMIFKNNAFCGNFTDGNPSGIFWKDDLNGDANAGTTISFDFTTSDFFFAFGVVFSTTYAINFAEDPNSDSFGDCVYVAGCAWEDQVGSGCNLVLGNTLGGFSYSMPTETGPWVNLVAGTTYHATVVKTSTFDITLTVSGPNIQSATVGPLNVGRKFTRLGLLMFNTANTDSCIDNLMVSSSTCPTDSFSTAAPVASLPTMAPNSRAPTGGPPTVPMPTSSPVTSKPTNSPSTMMPTKAPSTSNPTAPPVPTTMAPSSPPTHTSSPSPKMMMSTSSPSTKMMMGTSAPKKSASATVGSFLSIVLVAVGCLLF